jgi:hypothetical protein
MIKEALVLMVCGTGFGDQYAAILSGYKAYKDLISLGYETKVGFLVNNSYFSTSINLSVIWDLSPFECEVLHIPHYESDFLKDYIKIIDGGFHVYIKENDDEIRQFQFSDYSRHGLIYNSNIEFFSEQFIRQEILESTKKLVENKVNLVGIHLRIPDGEMHMELDGVLMNEYYRNQIVKIENHIQNNPQDIFMICSSNHSVKSYITKKFTNTFSNEFTTGLRMHNIMAHYGQNHSQETYIQHSKEILSEMAAFAYCKHIWSVNTFLSNFITYGIIHNKFHTDWRSKNFKLLIS